MWDVNLSENFFAEMEIREIGYLVVVVVVFLFGGCLGLHFLLLFFTVVVFVLESILRNRFSQNLQISNT
jgi:hypothetical protein